MRAASLRGALVIDLDMLTSDEIAKIPGRRFPDWARRNRYYTVAPARVTEREYQYDRWRLRPSVRRTLQCFVDDCTSPVSADHKGSLYCHRHREALIKTGDPHTAPPPKSPGHPSGGVLEDVELVLQDGNHPLAVVAERLGYDKPASLERALQRAGRHDLVRRMKSELNADRARPTHSTGAYASPRHTRRPAYSGT